MRRDAAEGGRPSARGYSGYLRWLGLGTALAFLVSLAAFGGPTRAGNVTSVNAVAPPGQIKKQDDRDARVAFAQVGNELINAVAPPAVEKKEDKKEDDKKGTDKKDRKIAFTMD